MSNTVTQRPTSAFIGASWAALLIGAAKVRRNRGWGKVAGLHLGTILFLL